MKQRRRYLSSSSVHVGNIGFISKGKSLFQSVVQMDLGIGDVVEIVGVDKQSFVHLRNFDDKSLKVVFITQMFILFMFWLKLFV